MNEAFDSDQDHMDSLAEPEEARDPAETTLEATPEALGLVPWSYSADAIQSFIWDIVSDLTFPMTRNLLADRLAELGEWFDELQKAQAA